MKGFSAALLFLLLLLYSGLAIAQSSFQISSTVGAQQIKVNGKLYPVDAIPCTIPSHHPDFDTLHLRDFGGLNGPGILCNFQPDSSYALIMACCGTTDIVPSWKLQHDSIAVWSEREETGYLQLLLKDNPRFKLRIKGKESSTPIYAWYADHACFPQFKQIDEKGWIYGATVKCHYWNNISPFEFFISQKDYAALMDENGLINDEYPDNEVQLMGHVFVRFFGEGQYTITYDIKSKEITVEKGFLN